MTPAAQHVAGGTPHRAPPRHVLATPQAEAAVVGAVLKDARLLAEVGRLDPGAFADDDLRAIWACLVRLAEAGRPVDVIEVGEELGDGRLAAQCLLLVEQHVSSANAAAYARRIREAARARAERVAAVQLIAALERGDYAAATVARTELARLGEVANDDDPQFRLHAVGIADLLARRLPPRRNLLAPWLPAQGLAMVYAFRGIGKTHLSLGIAYAVASGGTFLRWQAQEPAGVLFLDGEMPAAVIQERLAYIAGGADREPAAPLLIVNPDLQPQGMPDLSSAAGQAAVDALLTDDIRLIVIDNISTLVRGGKENEAESWLPVQAWALRQRALGRSVLFIHHAGKGGQQRGTSRREDVLDTVIALRRPADYAPEDGAVFEVHFEKARGLHGADVQPFEARLTQGPDGTQVWTTRSVEDSTVERVADLLNEGLSQAEIAAELDLHKSNVSRAARKAREQGLVAVAEKPTAARSRIDRRAVHDD